MFWLLWWLSTFLQIWNLRLCTCHLQKQLAMVLICICFLFSISKLAFMQHLLLGALLYVSSLVLRHLINCINQYLLTVGWITLEKSLILICSWPNYKPSANPVFRLPMEYLQAMTSHSYYINSRHCHFLPGLCNTLHLPFLCHALDYYLQSSHTSIFKIQTQSAKSLFKTSISFSLYVYKM